MKTPLQKTYWFTLLLLASISVQAQTSVPSLITSNQTWNASGSPYLLSKNTLIDSGVVVTILPGVTVKGNGGNFELMNDGSIQAQGNESSKIIFDSVGISFRTNAVSYDTISTGLVGSYFKYCSFRDGAGALKTSLSLSAQSVLVQNCDFVNPRYAIYARGGVGKPWIVDQCSFQGVNYYGYPIYSSGSYASLIVTNSSFKNAYAINLYGNIVFENNEVDSLQRCQFYVYQNGSFKCNNFVRIPYGTQVSLYQSSAGSSYNVSIENNTWDNCANTSSQSMLSLYYPDAANSIYSFKAEKNNFLNTLHTQASKLKLTGTNVNPANAQNVNFQNNYWNSTDSATIEGWIKDYSDDIKINGEVDFSPYASSAFSGCSKDQKCATAIFDFTIYNGSGKVDFQNASKMNTNNYVIWDLGDGDTSHALNNVSHTYSHVGDSAYTVCLKIYEKSTNRLCDSLCQTVNVFRSSCQANYYLALDTNKKNTLFVINNSTGLTSNTSYFWSFGDGTTSKKKSPKHKYSNFGLYELCLTLTDSAAHCASTYCDSIGLDSNGKLLKTSGFELIVLGELEAPEFNAPMTWNMYPNPTSGTIHIDPNEEANVETSVRVYNCYGVRVRSLELNLNTTQTLDVSELPDGMYIVELISGTNRVVKPIILRK